MCRSDPITLSCRNSVSCLGSDAAALLLPCVAQIRLYARPDAIASGAGDYALHITKRLLGFYQDYFKVQYSLPKLGKLFHSVFSDAIREVGGTTSCSWVDSVYLILLLAVFPPKL